MKRFLSGSEKRKRKKEGSKTTKVNNLFPLWFLVDFANSNASSSASHTPPVPQINSSSNDAEPEESVLSVSEDENSKHVGTDNSTIISEDPALWPDRLTYREQIEIVKKGPVQIRNFAFPSNTDKPPRKFTNENYAMKNRQKVATLFSQCGRSLLFWLSHLRGIKDGA